MQPQHILLVGATSAIAEQLARLLAMRGAALYLTGRDSHRLQRIAADLQVRGARQVCTEELDITQVTSLRGLMARADAALAGLDTVILAAGLLPDQERVNQDDDLLRLTMEVNATSAMSILNEAAGYFENQRRGQMVAIGSVAGDRGRAVNAAYGAAKGALEIFMSGLRQRLHPLGVQVLLVKPGFVDTPMTAAFPKGALWATPKRRARDILHGMDRQRMILYSPGFWRWIMLVIRHLPEWVFCRLRF